MYNVYQKWKSSHLCIFHPQDAFLCFFVNKERQRDRGRDLDKRHGQTTVETGDALVSSNVFQAGKPGAGCIGGYRFNHIAMKIGPLNLQPLPDEVHGIHSDLGDYARECAAQDVMQWLVVWIKNAVILKRAI